MPVAQPADRQTGSAKYGAPPPAAAPAKVEAAAKPDAKLEGKRSALNTLLDALTDIPAEEERTNPWDIPGDDSHDIEVTGTTQPNKVSEGGGKRKRSGKA